VGCRHPAGHALNDVIATCREHEREWLAELMAQLPVLAQQRVEAERVLVAAELQERKLAATGQWLQRFADDEGGFSITPLVVPQSIPPGARGLIDAEASLQRPWHRGRDWNPGEGAPARPTRRQPDPGPPPPDESEPGVRTIGDGVGVVFS
jgi:hypothetical protein